MNEEHNKIEAKKAEDTLRKKEEKEARKKEQKSELKKVLNNKSETKREFKEILSFTFNDKKEMTVKLIKEGYKHKIIVTDMNAGVSNKKVHDTLDLTNALAYFNKVVKLFTSRVK